MNFKLFVSSTFQDAPICHNMFQQACGSVFLTTLRVSLPFSIVPAVIEGGCAVQVYILRQKESDFPSQTLFKLIISIH